MQALNILSGKIDQCSTTYLVQSGRRRLLIKEKLAPPKPTCYVCSNQNVHVRINTETTTLRVRLPIALLCRLTLI